MKLKKNKLKLSEIIEMEWKGKEVHQNELKPYQMISLEISRFHFLS